MNTRVTFMGAGVGGSTDVSGNPGAAGWSLSEDEFDSRHAVMTKAEVRALALARLGHGPGMLVWGALPGTTEHAGRADGPGHGNRDAGPGALQ
jgi:hypothetical protein